MGLKQIGASSDYHNLGKQIAHNTEVENADTIIMKINGTPITREAFLNQKARLEMSARDSISYSEVKDKIIEYNVLWQEAKKRGLEASLEETQEYVNNTKQLLQQSVNDSENTPDNSDMIVEYITATGKSLDEFLADTIPEYQKMLSIGNLRHSIYNEAANQSTEKTNSPEFIEAQQKAFENLKQELCKEADIEELETLAN